MMRLALLALVLGCKTPHPKPPPDDTAPRYIAGIKERLVKGDRFGDSENELARDICSKRNDIADCPYVVAHLPKPIKLF